MALIRKSDIAGMTQLEIEEKIVELGADLSKLRSQIRSGGAPENSSKIREIRRTIARLKTFAKLKEGEKPEEKAKKEAKAEGKKEAKKPEEKKRGKKAGSKKPKARKPAKKAKKSPKSKK